MTGQKVPNIFSQMVVNNGDVPNLKSKKSPEIQIQVDIFSTMKTSS